MGGRRRKIAYHAEHHGSDLLEAVDPFSALAPLPAHVNHPEAEVVERELGLLDT
jgi:hypothetical protein